MPITRSGYAPPRQPHAQRYPWAHRKLRALITDQMRQGIAHRCARCHKPIETGQAWHLDHSPDRTTYLGPSHAHCNASAGNKGGV